MKRRDFLKYVAGAAAATAITVTVGKYAWDYLTKPAPPETDVLIVGAGLSGLVAAYELTKAGKKVIVLDSCHRAGGRIGTWHWPNGQYNDVGGEEVFDCDEHAWWLLNELGLGWKARRFTETGNCFLRGKFIEPKGWGMWPEALVQQNVWSQKAKEGYLDALERVTEISGPSYTGREPWLYGYLGSNYLDYDDLSFREWLLDVQQYDADVDSLISVTMKAEFGTTTDKVSAGEGIDYLYYWWWEPLVHLEGGNEQVITELLNRLPPGTVRLQSPVHRIANTSSGVEAEYADSEVITASAAITTVPHTETLRIIENLPSDKRLAIEKLTPTRLIYPFQQYSKRFWRTTTNSWTDDFLLTDLNPAWIVHGTALQEPENYGEEGILNQFVCEPQALELWSEQPKFRGPHPEETEASGITNTVLDDVERFWPETRDFLKSTKVLEYEYYGPARPARYVLDGYYLKNREPFENILFAGDWVLGFGLDAAVASARDAVSQLLAVPLLVA